MDISHFCDHFKVFIILLKTHQLFIAEFFREYFFKITVIPVVFSERFRLDHCKTQFFPTHQCVFETGGFYSIFEFHLGVDILENHMPMCIAKVEKRCSICICKISFFRFYESSFINLVSPLYSEQRSVPACPFRGLDASEHSMVKSQSPVSVSAYRTINS